MELAPFTGLFWNANGSFLKLIVFLRAVFVCYKNIEAFVQSCSMKKSVLINFAKFTGKHLCQSLFFKESL